MLILYLFLISFITVLKASQNEKRLQEDLIRGYNRLVRPVLRNTDQIEVKFGVKLIQVLDVDEKNQVLTTNIWLKHEWRDFNLRWDPSNYDNLSVVSIPSSNIWVPDIILFNSADGKYEVNMTRANIDYTGLVIWEPPAIYKSSCTINVEYFPFDFQHCVMKFGSWTYDGFQMNLIHVSQSRDKNGDLSSNNIAVGIDLLDFHQNHEWDVMAVPAERSIVKRSRTSKEFFFDLTFNIYLRRKTLFYAFNLIVPLVGISFLTVLTFYLPSESGEKISLCTFILVSLTFFVLLLYELIPPTSLVVPLVGKYILFTFVLVSLSILASVIVLNVHFRSPTTHSMPNWCRKLFLKVLPKVLLLKIPDFNSFDRDNTFFMNEAVSCFIKRRSTVPNLNFDMDAEALRALLKKNQTKVKKPVLKFNKKCLFQSRKEFEEFLDRMMCVNTLSDFVEHLKKEHREKKIKQEWRYAAMIIDRILLLVFTTSCVVGTISIILQAPSLYDQTVPIDQQVSRNF